MYGESIYNLVQEEYNYTKPKPKHISKHAPNAPTTGSTFGCHGTTRLPGAGAIIKKEGALFGPSKLPPARSASPPKDRDASESYKESYADKRKGPVPSKNERPVMGIRTSKNFITANAVEAILQVPRAVEMGEPNYMKKEDFGKVPSYLTQVKEEIRRENEMIQKYVKEQMGEVEREPDRYEEISNEERAELLASLKAKWDSVNANYQKITHLVLLDTAGQIRRKEQYEKQLTQLENDINRLQSKAPLLIR